MDILASHPYALPLFIAVIIIVILIALKPSIPNARAMEFWHVATEEQQNKLVPANFDKLWEEVEALPETTRTPIRAPKCCPYCGRTDIPRNGDYATRFTYGGFSWTGLDRHHTMFGHVIYAKGGYYMVPEARFIDTILKAYDAHHPLPQKQAPA